MAMPACSDITCASIVPFSRNDQTCAFDADPDVAGIGVLLSFIVTGCSTFLISAYIFFYVEEGFASDLTNSLDDAVIKQVRYCSPWLRPSVLEKQWLSDTLRQVVIMLSDQQLVLGLSILTVGYVKFNSMTEYHFAIVSSLSNISFVVHVTTIPVIKAAMFSNHEKEVDWKNFKRLWRAVAKLIFDVLLLVSFFPTGNHLWLRDLGFPVGCVWAHTKGNYHGEPLRTMIADMVLLCWGIEYELNAFFPILTENGLACKMIEIAVWPLLLPRKAHLWLNKRSKRLPFQHYPLEHLACRAGEECCKSLAVVLFVLSEVIYSQSLRLTRNWAMLISNTYRIFRLRYQAQARGRIGDENEWSFGQAVSMFVLLLPLCLALELLYDKIMEVPTKYRNVRLAVSVTPMLPVTQAQMEISNSGAHAKEHWFYFGLPDSKAGHTGYQWELDLYKSRWFRMVLVMLMLAVFVTVTYWAVKGWAF